MLMMFIMFMTCNGNKLSLLNTKFSEQAVHIFFLLLSDAYFMESCT
jgi:hypothetical protein